MLKPIRKTRLYMDTVVDLQVIPNDSQSMDEMMLKINRAFDWFRMVEDACSRFTRDSEVMKASLIIGQPVPVSPFLFEPLRFAMELAVMTNGVFDPTMGKLMEGLGFNQHYLTKEVIESQADESVTYKDLILDEQQRTVLFKKPMVVDLGAVAKGFAIDLAANEFKDCEGFVVNAGGDLFAGGLDEKGDKWKIAIQHPYQRDHVIETIEITNEACCTSGSYERTSPAVKGVHHIVNPQTKQSPGAWVSCSVIAPFAMMADAFSTAAFLEKDHGPELIERTGLKGILISPELQAVRLGGI